MKFLSPLIQCLAFTFIICGLSCSKKSFEVEPFIFSSKVDTRSRPINYQHKKIFVIDDVSASNDFPGARMNKFYSLNDSTYQIEISPENTPINESPWYAFKIWSTVEQSIYITLHYTEHEHRYHPKLSADGNDWYALDSNLMHTTEDSIYATMKLEISPDTLWVAAQEIEDHARVGAWVESISRSAVVTRGQAGVSALGRSMYFLNITKGENKKKPTIIVISRQHPPEVTGYLAMKSFVETIVSSSTQNGFLEDYRVMVYPLLNPDGVDLGHFRHNTGGVDLNRDWSFYHQPEIRQAVNHMVKESRMNKNNVILGLDFHSTYYDVYYTNADSVKVKIPGFTKEWLAQIKKELNLDDINEQPGGTGGPVSKSWFNRQFGAESITYEIGDDTPRDFIKIKGEVSANAMMDILMKGSKKWKL